MYLVCGEALFDFFSHDADDAARVRDFSATVGGSPLNLAVGLRRLDTPSGFCACISTDCLGRGLLNFLQNEGVNTEFVVPSTKPTTISLAQTDSDGLPHYAFYGVGAADTALTAADLPKDLSAIRGIHFGSYASAISPSADAFQTLLQTAAAQFLAYDPNVRASIQPDLAVWRARFAQYLAKVHYLKLSLDDFQHLFPEQSPTELAPRWLQSPKLQLVILTDEFRPIRAWHRRGYQLEIPPTPPRKVVDSVGAGDSFQAAMLAQFYRLPDLAQVAELRETQLRQYIQFASTCAAHTCAQSGANLPRWADVN